MSNYSSFEHGPATGPVEPAAPGPAAIESKKTSENPAQTADASPAQPFLPKAQTDSLNLVPDSPFRPHAAFPRVEALGRCPRVLITPQAYKRMLLFVEIASKEVGWLGTASRLDNGDFLIDAVFLLEQEVSATETELSVEGQNKLLNELLAGGDQGLETVNRLRFWGHSHVRMGTSPSWTDESTMRRFGDEGLPWYIRGIFNKRGRAEFTIYFFDSGYRICDAPWTVWDPQKRLPLFAEPKEGWLSAFSLSGPVVRSFPRPLVPSPELRQQVQSEFAAKVTEKPNWSLLFDVNRPSAAASAAETTSLAQSGADAAPARGSIEQACARKSPKSGWLSDVIEELFRGLFK